MPDWKKNSLDLRLHHIGCAVTSIEQGLAIYRDGMGFDRISPAVEITSQKVEVCFVEASPDVYLELVAPLSEDSPVGSFLKRRQHYYHICHETPSVPDTIAHLTKQGFRQLSLFDSEAFNGQPCAFLLSPALALVELCTSGSFTLL